MNFEVNSTNPVVQAVIAGTAPPPAKFAAARGILPLPQNDLLEILVALAAGGDVELAQIARETLSAQEDSAIKTAVGSSEVAPRVLDFFADYENLPVEIHEMILQNPKTPEQSIVKFARKTMKGELSKIRRSSTRSSPTRIARRKPNAAPRKSSANFLIKNAARSKSPTSFGRRAKKRQRNLSKPPNSRRI
jgi:hypothetical protein